MSEPLAPYVPRLVRSWDETPHPSRARLLDGSFVSADISGFTALAERLQTKGRVGAEELVVHISRCFDGLIGVAEARGGDVLKFRGDALLLLFSGERHAERAVRAACEMQNEIEGLGTGETSVGRLDLRMSCGVWSGDCNLFLLERPHRELIVGGPGASGVYLLEDAASAGEVAVGDTTAELVPSGWLGEPHEGVGFVGARSRVLSDEPAPFAPDGQIEGDHGFAAFLPTSLLPFLATGVEPEHRRVTVAFLRFRGGDDLLRERGPDELLARLDLLGAAVDAACKSYGVTLLESDIDVGAGKLYLTAGAPVTTGDDSEAMIRALRDVLATDVGLELSAGVNRGAVFAGDIGASSRRTYAVMGDAVNLAARLTGKAAPGEILVTGEVLDRMRTRYATASRRFEVKGKSLPIVAHAIGEDLGPREQGQIDVVPLIGRAVELEVLTDAVRRASTGELAVVELVGEAGMGKSRLVRELVGSVDGLPVHRIASEQYAQTEPYATAQALLRRVLSIPSGASAAEAAIQLRAAVAERAPHLERWLPLLGIPLGAEVPVTPEVRALGPVASRDVLARAVDDLLAAVLTQPAIVVLEDVHWIDDASATLISHVLHGDVARPWCVVATRRLTGAITFVTPSTTTRLELAPLDDAAADDLALSIALEHGIPEENVAELARRAAGNPLFLRELTFAARHGALETIPDTVESLLTMRFDTLDPADRQLLRYASVFGPTVETTFVRDALGDDAPGAAEPAAWERLGEFLVPLEADRLVFRHDLVRATAYEGLSFGRRREIHGRVGHALERRLGDRRLDEAALLSLHFHEAAEHERSWTYSTVAGERAAGAYANVVAAELLERALAAADELHRLPSDEIVPVAELLGDVTERFAAYDRSERAYRSALELALGVSAARLTGKLAVLDERASRYAEAIAEYDAAFEILDAAPDADLGTRAELELGRAGVLYRQGSYEAAIEWAEAAATHATIAGNRGALAHALHLAGGTRSDVGADGIPELEQAIALYDEDGDHVGAGRAYNNIGAQRYAEGRWDEAIEAYRRSAEARDRAGDVIGKAIALNNEAEVLSDQGRLEQAEPLFREMQRICRRAGYALGTLVATSNLGRVCARAGRTDEAETLYREAHAGFVASGAERFALETETRMLERLVLAGDHVAAVASAPDLAERAAPFTYGALEAAIHRLHGLALGQAGRGQDAATALQRSLELATTLGAAYEEALTRTALADVGAPDADAHREQATELLTRLGVVALPAVRLP